MVHWLQLRAGEGGVATESPRNVKWIDGLRGIASFLVILTHLARGWDSDLFSSKSSEQSSPRILQLPILRIPWQGRIGVTTFAFLTGYVCALKPIGLSGAGNYSAALSTIAKSAFRRTPRLVLPTTIATLIAFTLCQLGAFDVAARSDSDWMRYSSPQPGPSFLNELFRLGHQLINTWTTGHMDYDDHQWSLLPLLKGSMMVYVVLSATIYLKPFYRMVVSALLYMYFYQAREETFGMQVFYGMFLSDLSNHSSAQSFISSNRWIRSVVPPILIFSGLFIASYPSTNPEWCAWSNTLLKVSHWILPYDSDIPKFYTGIGLDLVAMGIHLSPSAKSLLSSRYFLWLGKNSFAVYLIHGTLLRVVFCWMIYGLSAKRPADIVNDTSQVVTPWIPRRSGFVVTFSIPAWLLVVYTAAHLWTTYVDAFCARLSQRLELHVFEENEKSNGLLNS